VRKVILTNVSILFYFILEELYQKEV